MTGGAAMEPATIPLEQRSAAHELVRHGGGVERSQGAWLHCLFPHTGQIGRAVVVVLDVVVVELVGRVSSDLHDEAVLGSVG
jgi:hypothetical protein